jgi:uncharacterized protein (TIGR02001 family)
MRTLAVGRIAVALACLIAARAQAQVQPSKLNVYVTIASDYLHRGLSQTDGDPALQVGFDYMHRTGLFLGVWGSNVDYFTEQSRAQPRNREVDYYIGYDGGRNDWGWTAVMARYAYADPAYDYDYGEVTLGVTYKKRFSYRVSYSNDLLTVGGSSLGQEFAVALPLAGNAELGAAIGHFKSPDLPGGDYAHFNVGVSKLAKRFTFDVRYYDTNYGITTHLGLPADRRWVASVSYGFNPI